ILERNAHGRRLGKAGTQEDAQLGDEIEDSFLHYIHLIGGIHYNQKMSLVVVGSVAYDGVETPHGKVERMLGGAATYIALAASYFTRTRLVGIVGDDFADED